MKETWFTSVQNRYYTENDFLVVSDASMDKMERICRDLDCMLKAVNTYPGYKHVSKCKEEYAVLFVCSKITADDFKAYLRLTYGEDLKIGELIDPLANGHDMCEFFKINCVQRP